MKDNIVVRILFPIGTSYCLVPLYEVNTLSVDYRLPGFIANMANYGTCQSNKRENGAGVYRRKSGSVNTADVEMGGGKINYSDRVYRPLADQYKFINCRRCLLGSERKTIRVININSIAVEIW